MQKKKDKLKELLTQIDEFYEEYKTTETTKRKGLLTKFCKTLKMPLKELKYIFAARRYQEGEDVKVISKEFGIPRSTLYDQFKILDVSSPEGKATHKKIRDMEAAALSDEAEKIGTIAIRIGGVIARGYLPLIEFMLNSGDTLETVAHKIMDWYEAKIPKETYITKLQTTIQGFDRKLTEAYIMAAPNFRYMLRTQILTDYAKRLLVARINGLRVPVRSTLRALENDLVELERDFEEMFVS